MKRSSSCAPAAAWKLLPCWHVGIQPYVVFTDTKLPDGTWEDVLAMAAQAAKAVNVIVVSRLADMRVYLDTIDKGARDFVAPPFVASDLAYVMRSAAQNVHIRRHGLAQAA